LSVKTAEEKLCIAMNKFDLAKAESDAARFQSIKTDVGLDMLWVNEVSHPKRALAIHAHSSYRLGIVKALLEKFKLGQSDPETELKTSEARRGKAFAALEPLGFKRSWLSKGSQNVLIYLKKT